MRLALLAASATLLCGAPPQRTMDIGSYSDGAPEHTAGSASEADEKLSWRSDPLESHSDWTVVVKVERNAKQAVSEANSKYTVHKNTLGFGPRKSEYLATIFQTNLKVLKRLKMPDHY